MHIGIGRHEPQLQRARASYCFTKSHATRPCAHVEYRNGLIAVNHQRNLADGRIDTGDLPQHARLVQYRGAGRHAIHQPFVDNDLAGVGVSCVIEHASRLCGSGHTVTEFQQLAKTDIFKSQLIHLIGTLGQDPELLPRIFFRCLGRPQGLKILSATPHPRDWPHGKPLDRIERGGQGHPKGFCDLKTRVSHHQKQRHGAEQHEFGQGRWTLSKEGRRGSVERTERHGRLLSRWLAPIRW